MAKSTVRAFTGISLEVLVITTLRGIFSEEARKEVLASTLGLSYTTVRGKPLGLSDSGKGHMTRCVCVALRKGNRGVLASPIVEN